MTSVDNLKFGYIVGIYESERGWGQKLIVRKTYDTQADADAAVSEENAKNTLPYAPDYYIYAKHEGTGYLDPKTDRIYKEYR